MSEIYIQTGNQDFLRIPKDYLKEDVTKRIEVEDVDQYFSVNCQKSALGVIRKFYSDEEVAGQVLRETMNQVVVIQASRGSDGGCGKNFCNLFSRDLVLPFSVILELVFVG